MVGHAREHARSGPLVFCGEVGGLGGVSAAVELGRGAVDELEVGLNERALGGPPVVVPPVQTLHVDGAGADIVRHRLFGIDPAGQIFAIEAGRDGKIG